MKSSSKIMTVMTVLLLSIGSDQFLKHVGKTFLQYSPPISFVNDFVRLQYAENRGIMFSIGASLSPEVRFSVFVIVVGFVLVGMLSYTLVNRAMNRMQTVAWSLVVSGGLGNLIDRIMRDGVVIDYVSVGFSVVRTAVFNLADLLVFAGVILLLFQGKKKEAGMYPVGPEKVSGRESSDQEKSL